MSFSDLSIEDIAYAIVRGGWPISIREDKDVALIRARDYVDAIINTDISKVNNISRSPIRARILMRSLARNISTLASVATIRNDIALGDDETISDKAIFEYLNVLDRMFVTENLPAWNSVLRSKTIIRISPKRQFVNPSIVAGVMRLTPERILEDLSISDFYLMQCVIEICEYMLKQRMVKCFIIVIKVV